MSEESERRIIELMEEMVSLQRITARPYFAKLIEANLDKPEKKLAYELTDGTNNREAIMAKTGAGAGTISGWWIEWFSQDLVAKKGSKYQRIFSLKDLGIRVPEEVNKSRTNKTNVPSVQAVAVQDSEKGDAQ